MLSLLLTGVFFVVELVVGLTIGSVALLADAAHNFSAAAGVGIALIGAVFASKPPTPRRTFGFL
jgi:cobalt-zinc-cadmium efflux system protein